jgi:hypothetical protein
VNGGENGRKLRDFFTQLADDPALYNNYLADPLTTMRGAGIPENLISAILTGNIGKLKESLAQDLDAGTIIVLGTIVRG